MKRKLLSMLLVCCMVFTMLPVPAFATEGSPVNSGETQEPASSTAAQSAAGTQVPASSDVAQSAAGTREPASSDVAQSAAGTQEPASSDVAQSAAGTQEPASSDVAQSAAGTQEPASSDVAQSTSETPEVSDALQAIYALVAALPEADAVTDDNRADVGSKLEELAAAYAALEADDQDAFDKSDAAVKLYAVNEALAGDTPETYALTTGTSGVYANGVQLAAGVYYKTVNDTLEDSSAQDYNVYLSADGFTLELKNANITNGTKLPSGSGVAGNATLYTGKASTLKLTGSNTITWTATSYRSFGIAIDTPLTITGGGSLAVTSVSAPLSMKAALTLDNCSLTLTCSGPNTDEIYSAIYDWFSYSTEIPFTLKNGASLEATGSISAYNNNYNSYCRIQMEENCTAIFKSSNVVTDSGLTLVNSPSMQVTASASLDASNPTVTTTKANEKNTLVTSTSAYKYIKIAQAAQCTVTWDDQGATTPHVGGSDKVVQGAALTLPTTDPVKTGYIFAGWYTKVNGGGTQVTSATTAPVANAVTYYAKWTALQSIGDVDLSTVLPAPAAGQTPTASISGDGYTGAVSWSPADTAFAAGTAYTATVTLKAADGYTLDGLTTDSFTYSGVNAGIHYDAETLTVVFPKTATAGANTSGILGAKFYQNQVWDAFRSPTFPIEGQALTIYNLSAPYTQDHPTKVDFSNNGYVTFESLGKTIGDLANGERLAQSVAYYMPGGATAANVAAVKSAALVKEVLNGTTTVADYGIVWALGSQGFLYTALSGSWMYGGGVGTFVSTVAHSSGDTITYYPAQDTPYTPDEITNNDPIADPDGDPTVPTGETFDFVGRVVDGSGAAVSGAVVKMSYNGVLYSATTNANGRFTIAGLAKNGTSYTATVQAGTYAVTTYPDQTLPDKSEAVLVYTNPGSDTTDSVKTSPTVTVSADSNGLAAPSGDTVVPYGGSLHITFAPNAGYQIQSVTVNSADKIGAVSNNSLDLTNITENQTVVVAYEKIPTTSNDVFGMKFTSDQIFDVLRSPAFPQAGRAMIYSSLKAPYDMNLQHFTMNAGDYITFDRVQITAEKAQAYYNSLRWYTSATLEEFKAAAYVTETLHSASGTRTLGVGLIWGWDDPDSGFLFTALDNAYYSDGVGTLISFKAVQTGSTVTSKITSAAPLPYNADFTGNTGGTDGETVNDGQQTTLEFAGIVLNDADSTAVPGATASVTLNGKAYTDTTDASGRFNLTLPAGTTTGSVAITLEGKTTTYTGVTLDVDGGFGNEGSDGQRTYYDAAARETVFLLDTSASGTQDAPVAPKVTVAISGGNGTAAPAGTTSVSYGSNLNVQLKPSTGYAVNTVTVDDADKTNEVVNNVLTVKNVTKNITVTVTFKAVAQAPSITTQPADITMEYGTTGKTLTVAATSPDGGTLSYQWYSNKTNSTEGGTSITAGGSSKTYFVPSQLAVGKYYYYCVVTNTRNGATATATSNAAAVTVNRLTPAAASFVFTAPSALGYNGSAKTASVVAASGITGMGTITVSYYSGDKKLTSAPTDAGTYTVKIDVTEGTVYSALTDFTNAAWKFTITPADVSNSGKDAQITYAGITYDVSAMFTRDSKAGTPTYSITSGGTGAGTLNGSVLTITKAGTIKITMVTAAAGNYAAGEATATLTVSKGSVAVPTVTGKTYNGKAQTADIAEVTGAAGYTVINKGGTNAGGYTVALTLRTPELYKWSDGTADAEKTLTFTIAQATNQWSSELACKGFAYDGTSKLAPAATADFGTVVYTYSTKQDGTYSAIPAGGIKTAGTYYIKAAVAQTVNYTGLESKPVSVTISKATLTPSVASVTGKAYDGKTTATGTITLAGAVNSEKPTATGTFVWTSGNAGTATVNVSGIALDSAWSANYQLSETALSNITAPDGAKISNAVLKNVSVAQKGELNYTGAAQTAEVNAAATAVNAQSVTFTYSSALKGDYTVAVPAFTAAGEYTVYYKAQAANHDEAAGSFTVTIGKKQGTDVSTPDAPTIGTNDDKPTSTSITIDTVAGNEYYISTDSQEPAVWPTSGDDYFKAVEDGKHTFTGLTAGTKYYIYTRAAETDNTMPSDAVAQEVYTPPVTPEAGVATIDYAKETISFESKYELSGEADFGTMIVSGGTITPDTLYYIRLKAIPGGAPASEAASFKTAARPAAPAAISAKDISKTDSTITVANTVFTQEYSIDNGKTWTNGNDSALLFSGLTAGRTYPVVTRFKAVTAAGSEAFASEKSAELPVAAKTAPKDVPNDHNVTFSVVDGTITGLGTIYEWRIGDSGEWSTVSSGIIFKEGPLYIRAIETETSMPGNALKIGVIKAGPDADAPVKESASTTSVTLVAIAGNEYSRDGGKTWQDSSVFTGLSANTAYGFVMRVKATADTLAGKTSPAATIKTNADNSGGPAVYMITATAGAGGDISTGQYVSVREGESAGFTMIPHKGYQVADVKVDGKSVGAVANYVFTNVRAAHTITVTFKVSSGHSNPQTGVSLDASASEK